MARLIVLFPILGGVRRAVLVYSFSIRNGDGSDREVLGFTDLLNDYAALAVGNDTFSGSYSMSQKCETRNCRA
jgi:hypothetical protein